MQYSFTCTCGHEMTVDVASREEAVSKLKGMMTEDAIKQHMADKHAGEPMMTKQEADMGIEQGTQQVMATAQF